MLWLACSVHLVPQNDAQHCCLAVAFENVRVNMFSMSKSKSAYVLMQLWQTMQHLASWLIELMIEHAMASLRPGVLIAAAAFVPSPHALSSF